MIVWICKRWQLIVKSGKKTTTKHEYSQGVGRFFCVCLELHRCDLIDDECDDGNEYERCALKDCTRTARDIR